MKMIGNRVFYRSSVHAQKEVLKNNRKMLVYFNNLVKV